VVFLAAAVGMVLAAGIAIGLIRGPKSRPTPATEQHAAAPIGV